MEKTFFVAVVGGGHCGKSSFARALADLLVAHLGENEVELVAEAQYLESVQGPTETKEYNYSMLAEDLAGKKRKVVIVEGFYLLARPETRHKFDESVFIDLSEEERFNRKLKDQVKSVGTALEIYKEFHGLDKPLYDRFVAPSKTYAKRVIVAENYLKELNKFAEFIREKV